MRMKHASRKIQEQRNGPTYYNCHKKASANNSCIYLCPYVMTVGFSLPVNSFSFDTERARSAKDI